MVTPSRAKLLMGFERKKFVGCDRMEGAAATPTVSAGNGKRALMSQGGYGSVKQYIGCDSHAGDSIFVSVDEKGGVGAPVRVEHGDRSLRDYLGTLDRGTPVAVEASGGWYWFMDELEQAGLGARLVNPLEAKRRMGGKHKTDKLDAKGLAILLRNGTLPEVWIPPAGLRDLRGLMRTRLATRSQTTVLKNRIHAALRRYGVMREERTANLFAKKNRLVLSVAVGRLPEETRSEERRVGEEC